MPISEEIIFRLASGSLTRNPPVTPCLHSYRIPHHGTLLKVSRDGARTEIVATGFRAANGVCVNDDGTFFVTDQEGHWTPTNRINRVHPGGFYGNMIGYHDRASSADRDMEIGRASCRGRV